MSSPRDYTLIVFSDVNFSPQLFAILQELHNQESSFRVVLIGDPGVAIAQQIKAQYWNLRVIPKRGKLGSVLYLLVLGSEILRNRPNVLFASGQFATAISMLVGKILHVQRRIFIRHHSNFHHKYNMRHGILVDKMANYLSTEIVAVSEVVKDILISNEAVNPKKVRLIYNGIELEKFQNVDSKNNKADYGQERGSNLFNIGVISRLTELKGVKYIAQAFAKLRQEFPNSRLHIVGAFSDSYSEVSNILSSTDHNSYTIEKENSDIPSFFRSLDAFIHVPVGVQDEAFGIVYIEALASGVACIFTQSGVLNELDDAQRYVTIVPPRDFEAIYFNLRKMLLGISNSRTSITDEWIKQFSLEKIAKDYAELLIGAKER